MTTYPLSEPATILRAAEGDKTSKGADEVIGQGSLADCAEICENLSAAERSSLRIDMNDMDLSYGPEEIEQMLLYLRNEEAGLSNKEISEIDDLDR